MTDTKEGVPQLQSPGRLAVCRSGRVPVELTSGDLSASKPTCKLEVTRMEFAHDGRGVASITASTGIHLEDNLRAAIGGGDFGG